MALHFACDPRWGSQNEDGQLFILNPLKLNFYTSSRYGLPYPEHPESLLRLKLAISNDYRDFRSASQSYSNLFQNSVEFDQHKYLSSIRQQQGRIQVDEKFSAWLKGRYLGTPIAVHPVWRDARQAVQQACFTLHGGKSYIGNTYVKEEDKLPPAIGLFELQDKIIQLSSRAEDDTSVFLTSIQIPREKKKNIVSELNWLGINYSLIFPELEHQAKYVKEFWSVPIKIAQKGDKHTTKSTSKATVSTLGKECNETPLHKLAAQNESSEVVKEVDCYLKEKCSPYYKYGTS